MEAEACERPGVSDLGVLLQGLRVLLLQQAQLCFELLAKILQVAVRALQGLFVSKQIHQLLLHPCCLFPGCCPLHFSFPSSLYKLCLLTFCLEGKQRILHFSSFQLCLPLMMQGNCKATDLQQDTIELDLVFGKAFA